MNTAPESTPREQPDGTVCGKCGFFVGALTRCPNCGARVPKRMSVMATRYAALLMAVLGLGLLYLMAIHRTVPLMKVSDIRPTMNFAYVRVAGKVSGDVRVYKKGDRISSLRFFVDDGTGEIPVTAYRSQAETLAQQDKLPRAGDQIEVAGSLAVMADDNIQMRLQVPDQLLLRRSETAVTRLGDVGPDLVGKTIVIEGSIGDVKPPRAGTRMPWAVVVEDGTGSRTVTFWEDIYAGIKDKINLASGERVRMRVAVDTYKDALQLKLNKGDDLEFRPQQSPRRMTAGPGAPAAPEAARTPIGSLKPEMAGQIVRIAGRVSSVSDPKPGTKEPTLVHLQEGGSEVAVVYWDTVTRNLGENKPFTGALMQVQGQLGVYQSNLQVKVNHSSRIRLLDVMPPSAPATEPGAAVGIASVTAAMKGRVCTVRGTLGEPESLRGGVKMPLTDETGSLVLLLWDRNVPGDQRAALQPGVKVLVTGLVSDYKGVLQLVPQSAQAVQVQP